ncbi:Zinc finger protein [Drechslerella dactyloides]|uniref:Zinc finger protein n=1 Tax=Drechslerella dactyloides TaxID=74499 RepID=A0AAD6NGF7_DREDA|nr:Zinc finger protein [Drechslerella dactyloides]
METIRQGPGHVAPQFTAFSNGNTAQDSNYGVQFSNPWKGGPTPTSAAFSGLTSTANDLAALNQQHQQQQQSLRHNSVSTSFEQMNLNLPTSRAFSSHSGYATDFMPGTSFPTTYADTTQTATSPTARAPYNVVGFNTYDQAATRNTNLYNTLPSSLAEDRRFSHPGLLSPTASSLMDSPLEPLRQRQASLIDYTRPSVTGSTYHTSDTLDSARGMLALNQNATRFNFPHNGHRASSSASSSSYYPQSTASSISSASSYPYYSGSMDSTGSTDLTSISDMYDSSRPNLPRPMGMIHSQQMMHHHPTGQAAMMGQFSSRIQSSAAKKHKCKVCDKRFTRPSSLQTHMYSHTGEKPFACEVEGCGRQFSVVSNLRRHRKVHKAHSDTETVSNSGSM